MLSSWNHYFLMCPIGNTWYKVQWEGYKRATWVYEVDCDGCPDLINEFLEGHDGEPASLTTIPIHGSYGKDDCITISDHYPEYRLLAHPLTPFPFKAPVIINCHSTNLLRIQNDGTENAQNIWLKIIAIKNEDDNGHLDISFYGLTHVNNYAVLPTTAALAYSSGNTCDITIPIVRLPNTTKFRFNYIPTITNTNDERIELMRFCSAHSNITWTHLQGFGAVNNFFRFMIKLEGATNLELPVFNYGRKLQRKAIVTEKRKPCEDAIIIRREAENKTHHSIWDHSLLPGNLSIITIAP
ncbi:hypothetical protein DAPPUDRAFT_249394 [Daphnia pulex]|uniref:Uncharacterized protein n=1 Tax=Daphnia pulex TaxID=6669 RepID=E9GWK7_DAPPU|nr:hypothetical protein DAPPUDRAFT_249394 [Daphnia pulex]|eukprot:EFX76171.1 hypothetical protein DAPPUDRAFT_249394 [Daphnia pulex]